MPFSYTLAYLATNVYVGVCGSQISHTGDYDYVLVTGNTDNPKSLIQYDMHSFPVSGPATSSGELPTKHYTTISKPVSSDVLTLILIAETLDQAFFEEMINKISLEVSGLSEEYEDEDEDGSYDLEDDDRFYDEEWYEGSFQGKYFFLKWVVEHLVWEKREGAVA